MNKDNMVGKTNGTSKLALLRQNRGIKKEVDISKAIEGFASSIDSKTMIEEIERNSAHVNLIIDCSGSMNGTSKVLAKEINEFAIRQSRKIYETKLSLTLFDHEVYPQFSKINAKQFKPIYPWDCTGGTNIHDAIVSAIFPTKQKDAYHRLHLIITDGQNGRSQHSEGLVKELIEDRCNSEHVFLLFNDIDHMNINVSEYAASLGIKENNAVKFERDGDGIKIIFQAIEDLLDGLRTNGVVPQDWAKAIQAHALNPLGVKAREIKYLE